MPRIFSNEAADRLNWAQVYTGVAITTLATLLLELSLTRIFSVVFYYHFAFLAISIALFGLGAGGVLSYLFAGKGRKLYAHLGTLSAAVSVTTVLALVIILTRTDQSNLTLTIIYFTSALPFMLAGAIVSLAISETIARVDRVYFFDLLGAAGGCLALVPLLNTFGGPNTVIIAGILFAVSASLWFNLGRSTIGRVAAVALALLLTALVGVNMNRNGALIDVTYAKGQRLANEIFVRWNSFSRIAVAPEQPGGMHLIVIDADASTGIAKFDFSHLTERNRKDLMLQGPALPYHIRPGAKTLIIGPGGGWDVARALATGSKDITGVEINPIIARTVMQKELPHLSNHLYDRPEVRIEVEDGRSFIRRSDEKYQVLQATLVDTWASTAAGAFALSENNLYTTEAFYDYLSHLTNDGILSFTRWGFDPPRESLRLISLAKVALTRLGETDHARHVIVARAGGQQELQGWGATDTIIISRKALSKEDIENGVAAIQASGMHAVYYPGTEQKSAFAELLTTSNPERFYENYPYDVSPVTDNRPFFFYTVQPRDLLNFLAGPTASADYKINRAVPLLFGLLAISIVATAVILLLPPLTLGNRLPWEPRVLCFLPYFVCIGAGYILIQVALIQKFVLLLGHPTYALTVIIFSMLVSSGVGSYVSRRVIRGSDKRLKVALICVASVITLLALVSPSISHAGITWPLSVKILVTAALITPAGFLMGMPFPTGLGRLERQHPPSVRWAWALNAASSVLGSAAAIFLAIYLGLGQTLLVGGALYVGAAIVIHFTKPEAVTG